MKRKLVILFIFAYVLFSGAQAKDCQFRYEGLHSVSPIKMDLLLGGGRGCEPSIVSDRLSYLKFIEKHSVSRKGDFLEVRIKEKPTISNFELRGFSSEQERFISENIVERNHYLDKEYAYRLQREIEAYLVKTGFENPKVDSKVSIVNERSVKVLFVLKEQGRLIVGNVSFSGVRESFEDELRESLNTRERESFSWVYGRDEGLFLPEELNDDTARIREFYLGKGYVDVQVSKPQTSIEDGRVSVGFVVVEGDRYSIQKYEYDLPVHFTAGSDDVEKRVVEILSQASREVFDIKEVRKLSLQIKDEWRNAGYYEVEVVPTIERFERKVAVKFKITPGNPFVVNNVYIGGNNKTLDRVVRRGVFLYPGLLYSKKEVDESENALRRTGFFESVEVKPKKLSNSTLDAIVKVKEAKTGSFMMGGGYGSQTGFSANVSLNERNFFGSAWGMSLYGNLSEMSSSYGFGFENPSLNDGDFSLNLNIYKHTYQAGEDELEIKRGEVGLNAMLGYSWNRYLKLGVGVGYEDLRETYLKSQEGEEFSKRTVSGNISFNNTDGYYFPRNGFAVGNKIEYAGFDGNIGYLKNSFSYRYFKSLKDLLGHDAIFRHRVGVGYLEYQKGSSALDGYTLGGISTVRGYENYAFGLVARGDEVYDRRFSNSVEISVDSGISPKLRAGIFYDIGGIGRGTFLDIVKQGYGAAVEWYSPIGPIQFIFADAINPGVGDRTSVFEFSIGQQF